LCKVRFRDVRLAENRYAVHSVDESPTIQFGAP
jgi:hypothetical protein